MKFKSLLTALSAAAFLFIGCQPKEDPKEEPSSLTISPTGSVTIPGEGGFQNVSVTSNRAWKIQCDADWLTFSVDGKDIKGVAIDPSSTPVVVKISALSYDGLGRNADVVFNGGTTAKATLNVKQEGAVVNYSTIAEIRAMLVSDKVKIAEGVKTKGVVNSNAELNNLTSKKSLYIQDETGGINVFCAADHSFNFGDEIALDLSGESLENYHGSQEINGIDTKKITLLSSGKTIEPKTVAIADFLDNKYEGQYVAVENVEVTDADLSKTWVVGGKHTSINIVAKSGETFVVRSSSYSTFGATNVAQGSGIIKGIATMYDGTCQLIFAQITDYAGLTGERFEVEGQEITIDEAITKKNGSATVKGRVIACSAPGFVLNDGTNNNLYVAMVDNGVEKGDIVKVSGDMTTYGPAARLNGSVVKEVSETIPDTPDQPIKVLGGNVTGYTCNGSAERISITGVLSTSTSGDVTYYNLKFDGIEKPAGSVYSSADISSYVGKRITVEGYFAGSTSNYFMIVAEKIQEDTSDHLIVTPMEIRVAATATNAQFNISTNLDWSVSSDNIDFEADKKSGTGDAVVIVSFPENTDITKGQQATLTVNAGTLSETVTIIQAAADDPSVDTKSLTYEEIRKTLDDLGSTSTTYTSVTYKSESGDWESNSSPNKSNKWVQLRDTKGSYLKSPVFSKNIKKIEISTDANKGTQKRSFYAVSSSSVIPKDNSNSYRVEIPEVLAASYGSATADGVSPAGTAGEVGETITLTFTGDTKDFMLLVVAPSDKGAAYIHSIKVFF